MNTQVIVIGEEKKVGVQIELFYIWGEKKLIEENHHIRASEYDYVELMAKDYFPGLDLIFCYYNPNKRGDGSVFLGRWNDGVV